MINILIGIFIGIILLILYSYIQFKSDYKKRREEIGEDYEIIFLPKSDVEKVREYLEKENGDWYEIRTKNKS